MHYNEIMCLFTAHIQSKEKNTTATATVLGLLLTKLVLDSYFIDSEVISSSKTVFIELGYSSVTVVTRDVTCTRLSYDPEMRCESKSAVVFTAIRLRGNHFQRALI